jgi:hypothetical protein
MVHLHVEPKWQWGSRAMGLIKIINRQRSVRYRTIPSLSQSVGDTGKVIWPPPAIEVVKA